MLACWLLQRLLFEQAANPAMLNVTAAVDALAVVAAVALSRIVRPSGGGLGYLLTAHAALLLWLLRELRHLPDGQGYVTIAWGPMVCCCW